MRTPRNRKFVVVAVTLAAALGLGAAACGSDSKQAETRQPSKNATKVPAAKGPNDAVMTVAQATPQKPAATALAAVTTYLDAEIAGRFEDSFALLSAKDRDGIGSADAWRDLHSSSPRVTYYSVASKANAPVVTETTFEPRVDETVGVIPGSAAITWTTVSEGGGFTINRAKTEVAAHYPDPSLTAAGVTDWLKQITADDPPVGYLGSIVGQPDLPPKLAKAKGAFTPGEPIELSDWSTPEVVTNAFGPEAGVWARIVHVDGPIAFDAVLAPFGNQWVVVGVVAT